MAGNNIQVSDLDFNLIKNNLKTFMKGQDVIKDYNFEGSAMSVLLDVLAYNTQYNAYYLNMVANEMFLDSAIQRSSVVSHAKLLGYVPRSTIAPTATINLTVSGVTDASLTLQKDTSFLSEAISGVSYNFVTTDSTTVNTINNTANFTNIILKQGITTSQRYVVDPVANPNYIFVIPDNLVDTTTIKVSVQQTSSNGAYTVFTHGDNALEITKNSPVFFLQEGIDGKYQISFGDDILGIKLIDGNIVNISYVVSQGVSSSGANNFSLRTPIVGNTTSYPSAIVTGVSAASNGMLQEDISSIKYHAPKSFYAQNRAVTKDDYITAIQQNKVGLSFDAVNVWGGEENDVPVYGQVFISLKPKGSYNITEEQKKMLLTHVIKPISMIAITPNFVDPDYTYMLLNANVSYNPSKSILSSAQVSSSCITAISNYAANTLNTFNSTYNNYGFLESIMSIDTSIVSSSIDIRLQKKFYPNTSTSSNYTLKFDTSLNRGILSSGVTSSPAISVIDPEHVSTYINNVYIEEIPTLSNSVQSISILNPGIQYTIAPDVKILGDGVGATAHAVLSTSGSIKQIVIDNSGNGYTDANILITNNSADTNGKMASAVAILDGAVGVLRTFYINTQQIKTVLNNNAGTIDYAKGIIQLTSFNPIKVDNTFGDISIIVTPTTNTLSSSYNRLLTLDPFDPHAIAVNIKAST